MTFSSTVAFSQMPEIDPEDYTQGSLGFGVGLDYGGIGVRMLRNYMLLPASATI